MAERRRSRAAGSQSPVRITEVQASRAEDIRARQRRYLWSMLVRTICFVGAVAVGPGWLRWTLVAGAIFLPYVAVIMANAADNRNDAFRVDRPGMTAPELPPAAPPDRAA
jgi:hypothetical protein